LTDKQIQHLDSCGINEAYVNIDLELYEISAAYLSEMLSQYFGMSVTVDDFELQALSHSLHVSTNLFRIIVRCHKGSKKEQFGIIAKHFLQRGIGGDEAPQKRYQRELITLRTLFQQGCHLPNVYGCDDSSRIIYMQDLGKILLTDVFREVKSSKRQWLLKATKALARIHEIGTLSLKKSQFPFFDAEDFTADLRLCYHDWIISTAGKKDSSTIDPKPLIYSAALCLCADAEKQFTIYDCKATHVMIHNDETYFIDAESSLFGLNPLYSLAGLAIAADDAETREEMLFCYLDQRPDFARLFDIPQAKRIFDVSLLCVLIQHLNPYLLNEQKGETERYPFWQSPRMTELEKSILGYPEDTRGKGVQLLQEIQHQSDELEKLRTCLLDLL